MLRTFYVFFTSLLYLKVFDALLHLYLSHADTVTLTVTFIFTVAITPTLTFEIALTFTFASFIAIATHTQEVT